MTGEEDTNIRKLGSWDQFDMGKTGEGVRGKQEGERRVGREQFPGQFPG